MMSTSHQRLWAKARGTMVGGHLFGQEPTAELDHTVLGLDFICEGGRWGVTLAQVKVPVAVPLENRERTSIDYEPGTPRREPCAQLPADPDRAAVEMLRNDLRWAKDMRVQIGPHAAQLLAKVCDVYLDEE